MDAYTSHTSRVLILPLLRTPSSSPLSPYNLTKDYSVSVQTKTAHFHCKAFSAFDGNQGTPDRRAAVSTFKMRPDWIGDIRVTPDTKKPDRTSRSQR